MNLEEVSGLVYELPFLAAIHQLIETLGRVFGIDRNLNSEHIHEQLSPSELTPRSAWRAGWWKFSGLLHRKRPFEIPCG